MILTVLFSAINSVLLVVLMLIYGKIVIKTRASYAIGLMIFAILLLAENLLSVFAYVDMEPFFGAAALPYLLGMSGLELAGIIVLLRVTL